MNTSTPKKKVRVMRYNVVVATHHKTGTVWMDGVFKALAGDRGARYINFRAGAGRNPLKF